MKRKKLKHISIDNGNSYMTAAELMEYMTENDSFYLLDKIYAVIPPKLAELAHNMVAPCTDEEYLNCVLLYLGCDLVIG